MRQSPRLLNASVYMLAIISLVTGYLLVSDVLRRNYEQSLTDSLASNLATSESAIERWVDTRVQEVLAHSMDHTLVSAAQELLPIAGERELLLSHPAQERLRFFFGSFLHLRHVNGYFIIAPDGTSLASSRNSNIGTPNVLLAQPVMFQQLLDGEALVTGMRRSDVPLSDNNDIRDNISNFAAAPLRDENGEVIAILALRLFPKEELFQLLNFVEGLGNLQTYAFNDQGALLSNVRDLEALRANGTWNPGEDHLLFEPGASDGTSYLPPRMIEPVRRALQGENGLNIDGYLNYAGEEKVGAWSYFDKLSFGIVIEQPRESAYSMARFFQTMTIIAFSIGLVVATAVFLLMLEAGKRVDTHRKRLLATMKATRDVNFQLSAEGIIYNVNDALHPVFGLDRRGGIGHSASRFLDLGLNTASQLSGAGLKSLAQLSQAEVIRCQGIREDGSRFPIGIRVEELSVDGKTPDEFLIVVHDYNDIERRETELRDALERAESGNRTKSSFLSTISHELRSPLISVIAALELLTDRARSNEDRNLLDSSQRSAQLLLGIIDDILDYSRMEAGKLELAQHGIALETVLQDVTEVLRWQAWNNDVELLPYCDPHLPKVQADGLRLRQILLNLTSNAIKFSAQMRHRGKVSISLKGVENRKGQLEVTLRVRDNGIGMTQETMNQIFQPFTQADGTIRRKYGGTGLGLTISDRLIKMMDGHISVMSDPGEGTVFEVKLPMDLAEETANADEATETAQPLAGLNVLVQAVDPAVADTVRLYAQQSGATVANQTTGSSVAADFVPDILVVHAVGASDATLLRKRYGPLPMLQIHNQGREIAPTTASDRAIALTSLLPSVVVEQLVMLRLGMENSEDDTALIPQSKVLLIEDDEMTREITLRMLKQLGIAADAVVNGQEGLDLWRSGQYALLLSDCHMPIMDGFQMAAKIRDEEGARNLPKTPIVAVSADLTMEVERLCVDCEIDEYVPKPLTPAKLKAIVQSHVNEGRKRLDS